MLTAEGCRTRRQRLLDRLTPSKTLVLADNLHLRYFANAYVDPFSLGADFGGLLAIEPDGKTTLYHDHRVSKSIEAALVDERKSLPWYDGQTPGHGPRRMVLRPTLEQLGGRIHDCICDPDSPRLFDVVSTMRRAKDADEVALLKRCCEIAEAGFAWARANVKAGMTELDVYEAIFSACSTAAGKAVIVYGDFAVSPGSAKRGGPPTGKVLQNGETLILDYSVILQGYRSDFTNTLVVGGQPTAPQQQLMTLSQQAMASGEAMLKAGRTCQAVYDAVAGVFNSAGFGANFPHHAGHGLGLQHPEAPFFVKHSQETLMAGDVVTLEPGLYVDGVGGVRIEHNYLITPTGYERLSNHVISLV
ncbi:MAG: Xaa-Pro peptidase family protein [Gemmataceae bacterium]